MVLRRALPQQPARHQPKDGNRLISQSYAQPSQASLAAGSAASVEREQPEEQTHSQSYDRGWPEQRGATLSANERDGEVQHDSVQHASQQSSLGTGRAGGADLKEHMLHDKSELTEATALRLLQALDEHRASLDKTSQTLCEASRQLKEASLLLKGHK